jgi:hypothetical protein
VLRRDSYRRELYAMSQRREGAANRNLPRVHNRMILPTRNSEEETRWKVHERATRRGGYGTSSRHV